MGELDENSELYGYGVYNTHEDQLVERLDSNGETGVFRTEEELLEFFQHLEENVVEDTSHLRIVQIRLDNQLDERAVS
jgi:hypothetical protein